MTVRPIIALLLGFSCALLVACTDRSALIPANDAAALKDDIAAVQQALSSGDCDEATSAVRQLSADADNLPSEIDSRLRSQVIAAARRAERLVPSDCRPAVTTQTTATSTTTVPTTTATTTTIPTTTTTTTTIPTTTTTTTPDGTGGIGPGNTTTIPSGVTP